MALVLWLRCVVLSPSHLLFDFFVLLQIGAGETIRGLVERICAKRGLDAGACGLFEGGAIVARSAPASSLRGRTLRLGSDSPPPLPPLLPASSGSTSPRGPLVKQRSVPTIPVNEIDAAQVSPLSFFLSLVFDVFVARRER